ncbi:hypothetical protein L1987_34936 [Smallanthus sonchifolius]|uniref:Uncharacterized protein n=1 Tax=Smallanthus sonchifolius TaxID=185202 RepID=A0ACB9HVM4_9ASTR|nr:hypothetical protein L1987_34936 [Smallanthus sonchifolius]
MLGLKSHSSTHQISSAPLTIPIRKPQTILKPFFRFPPNQTHSLSHLQLKSRRKNPRGFNASFSEESNGNGGGAYAGTEASGVKLRWSELLLDPDRDNVVAVGLTGALAWAGVQVMWQLFVVTMAVLIAAIKYTFVGVLLIFIVITLL